MVSCTYCEEEGLPCTLCSSPWCTSHLPLHRPSTSCLPPPCVWGGGGLLAAAPLPPGTLVLRDTPLLLLPEEGEELCCTCTSATTSRCPHCGLWLCCREEHLEECGVVRRWRGDGPGLLTALGLLRLLKEVGQASGLHHDPRTRGCWRAWRATWR